MPEGKESRISWNEPVHLDGSLANDVREILEHGVRIELGNGLQQAYERLYEVFIPPVAECEALRQHMHAAEDYFGGITHLPDISDANYDEQIEPLNQVLAGMRLAFNNRPAGCEMEKNGMDAYDCDRCHFSVDIE